MDVGGKGRERKGREKWGFTAYACVVFGIDDLADGLEAVVGEAGCDDGGECEDGEVGIHCGGMVGWELRKTFSAGRES